MSIKHLKGSDAMENEMLVESNGTEVDSGPQKEYHDCSECDSTVVYNTFMKTHIHMKHVCLRLYCHKRGCQVRFGKYL